jgi:hypothetical protein
MDTTTTDDIARHLHRFATAVQETRANAPERSSFGRYRAGAPYFEQYPLRRLMDSSESSILFTPALQDEYRRISADLAALERERGRAYREELFRDLSAYTEAYRTMLCYLELGLCDAGEIAGHLLREEIGVLISELEGEFPLSDIGGLVTRLDEAFRSIREFSCSFPLAPEPSGKVAIRDNTTPIWQCQCSSRAPGERTGPL